MKRMKSILCVLLAATLLLLGGCAAETPTLTDSAVPPTVPTKAASFAEAQVGQVVEMGHYEQDNVTDNGAELILWLVIQKAENRALVVSLYGLDNRAYHETDDNDVTWETCSLRTWLNGAFVNSTFTDAEKAVIVEAAITNPENPGTDVSGGNDTVDRIFLLSIGEVNQYMPNTHDTETTAYRAVWPTAYALAQGAFQDCNTGNAYAWLRAPGRFADMAARINTVGEMDFVGSSANHDTCVVRPAMWVSF